ncbi:hypothetical protein ACFOVU_21545 [Nocardiopsis sediminis]|uniref:DUF4190 domain-containing protein n=1 Tax=Nocardiopsis sediminis TaxID=1778267 RepID=A0ABV8FT15_9ACTN
MSDHMHGAAQRYWDGEPASPGATGVFGRAPIGGPPRVPAAAPPAPFGPGPAARPPSGPPARVGSAVAGLICALLTLFFPLMFLVIGLPLLALLVNIPGIAFGVVALTRTADPPEVERFIRYTWAGTMIYLAVIAVIVVGVMALFLAV